MAFPIVTAQEQIGQLYVAYFGRAADPVGLDYWVTQLNGGLSLTAIANSFAVQPEATALYSYLAAPAVGDPAAFVKAIYNDLFNRDPDAAGLDYWVDQLTVAKVPPGTMILNVISGAQGADLTTIQNKTHVAVDYAQKFVNANLTWIAIDNTAGAQAVVEPVTSDPATVVAAIARTDAIIVQEQTNPQGISLVPNATTILSGGAVDVVLQADPSQANKTFQYTISGIQSSEIQGGKLTGSVVLGTDSKATIHIGTITNAANLNTPNETIKVTVGPISSTTTLTEGTQTVSQTGPVNEGQAFNVSVATSNIAAGAASGLTQSYTITGPGIAHVPVAERSGTVVLDQNGNATISVHTLATLADSGTTTVTVTVGNDAPVNVIINETAVQQVTPSSATILEGAQVIFTVTTTGVAGSAVAGQVESWVLSGAGTSQVDGPLSGTIVLDQNGTATITVSTLANVLNGPALQNLAITILSGAVPTANGSVDISEGTQTTTNSGPVSEGTAFSFSVATTGVANGSVEGRVESYTITGPGLAHIPVAERSGTVTLDANGNATVTVHTLADLAGSGTTSVSVQVGNNAASTVTINETVAQSVTPSAATILEGGPVVFTINTTGVAGGAVAGQVETWTLSGGASGQVDGPLSGTVTLDTNGSATVSIATLATVLNGVSPQDLVFTLKSGSTTTATATVNVTEGTQATTNTGPVNEGSAFSFSVATTNVAPGSVAGRVEAYTITGPGLAHIPVAERSGTVTLDASGNATVTVHTLADLGNTGTTSVSIQVGNNAASTVTINETTTQSVTPSSDTILEGAPVVFTINTVGVLGSAVAGQVETWTLSGPASAQIDGPLSGTVTLDSNGSATVSIATLATVLNGVSPQDLVFTLKSGSTTTATGTVHVSEGTQTTTAPNAVVEGGAFTFSVATTGVASGSVAGRVENYTISGPGLAQIPAAERTGTVTLDANGNASVTVHTLVDLGVLGFKPIGIQVGNNAAVTVDILDQAFQTVSVSPANATINQGQSLTFTVNTQGVAGSSVAGLVQSWTLTGSGTNQVTGGVLSGTVTLDSNGSAVVTVNTDFKIINGPLTQSLTFRLDSGGFPDLSRTVTINEATLTVTPPAAPVVEGNQVSFTISGVNIPNGTTFAYTLSGSALGNVVPASQIHGLVTLNNNTATVVVNTLSTDASGLTKGLTLTIDDVSTATGTAQIAETAPISFILTTGTDTFVGNPNGLNTFFAVANSNPLTASSTLGQNDNLDGKGTIDGPNTLFLQTTGILPQLINAFTTNNIQIFNINPGQAKGGTTVDMSSVFGMTKVIDANASGRLTLLNVTASTDVELQNPSDILAGVAVDLAIQYQNNAAKPTTQTLTLDPTVSPITGLANSRFWVNVPQVSIASTGIGTNGLIAVNGATNGLAATALTRVTMLGTTHFVAGTTGSGQVALAFTGAAVAAATNLLDLSAFAGTFFDVGDPSGPFAAITASGGLTINSGAGGMQGTYTPGAGFTGATQVGGLVLVGGNLELDIGNGTVNQQTLTVGGAITVLGTPLGGAAGGLIDSLMTTFGGAQTYKGFNGGLSGSIMTNDGVLNVGEGTRVNGTINLAVSTGTGAAVVFGGNGDVTLDFSGAGTTGFHGALNGPGSYDRFFGGTGTNTLIFDPMINNRSTANGQGWATGVQIVTLQSPAGTPWDGTEGGTPGVLPTNTVDLGILNLKSNLIGIDTGFAQTININGPLGSTGQTFQDAVSNDEFVLDSNATPGFGGGLLGQVMAFDFAQPTANNAVSLTLNNVNSQGGFPSLILRDFETSSAAAGDQNPITTLNLTLNRDAAFANLIEIVRLEDLDRLTTLNLAGTANNFDDDKGTTGLIIDALGGGGTLTRITGGNGSVDISLLAADYMSKQGGTITLGNGSNVIAAFAGNWTITSGKVPGGGTAGDSGDNLVFVVPGLGDRHTVKTGGGNDIFAIGPAFAFPMPTGGIVDIMSGAGNDRFFFDQSGLFPMLNSAQKIDGGTGRDRIELVDGALNQNDSLFGQITNVEILAVAGGFNNSLLLNFFANQSGLDTISTNGDSSSNVFFEGTGFTNKLTYNINLPGNGLDDGGNAIIVAQLPSGTNAITVNAFVSDYNVAFESGLLTAAINPGTGLPTLSGIFANANAQNTLNLRADLISPIANVFGTGLAGTGTNNVQTINGLSNAGAPLTIFLANDPALGSKVATIDLGKVNGDTTLWGQASTTSLTITGGTGSQAGGLSTLIGGSAADTITAQGNVANWIWGFGGGDIMTGAAGDPGLQTGGATTFVFNTLAELQTATITNFHFATDSFFVNPVLLTNNLSGSIFYAGFGQTYFDVLKMMQGSGNNPPFGPTYAVYEQDNSTFWIDANNDGLLNALDGRIHLTFGSVSAGPGEVVFQSVSDFNSAPSGLGFDGKNVIVTVAQDQTVSFGTVLQPGQTLFGGPGLNDTLSLEGSTDIQKANIGIGQAFAFEHLVLVGADADISMAQYNWFRDIPGHSVSALGFATIVFTDNWSGDPVQTKMTTTDQVANYDFHLLTNTGLTSGITLTTPGFTGGPFQGLGAVLGTTKDDVFNVADGDLQNDFEIDGGGGEDTLNVDATLVFGTVYGDVGDAGQTNAVVRNVQTLNLMANGLNVIGFNPGTEFTTVNGGDNSDTIVDPENLAGAWTLNLGGGPNAVQINASAADLSAGKITVSGAGTASLAIIAMADSNTTLTFAEYALLNAAGIDLSGGSTFGNTTITFADAVTGGAVLSSGVGNWVFSSADDTFALGQPSQNINVGAGGKDTVIIDIGVIYDGTFTGGSGDDTVRFATVISSISGVNGGSATGFGILDFGGAGGLLAFMTVDQHNGFNQPFVGAAGVQVIQLDTSGTAAGDGGIEKYILAGGGDVFTVARDNGAFNQSIDITLGGSDTIVYGTGTFTGRLDGGDVDDTIQFTGDADVSGVGALAPGFADFANAKSTVTMTLAQYILFSTPFLNTSDTQTIVMTGGGVATGDDGIEDYVLVGGAFQFTIAIGLPSQNVDLTGSLGSDTIVFGGATFTGSVTGATADDAVMFVDNADISGENGGDPIGAGDADFNNHGLSIVFMTLAQHNDFKQPFSNTGNAQEIWLTTSGAATGDGGIETYVLAGGDDTFTIAKDSGSFDQSVNLFKGGADTVIFGAGTYTGFVTNADANDTFKFTGDADISGVFSLSLPGKASFSGAGVKVTMTLGQHNGFAQPFLDTTGAQTIELTTSGTAMGDGGIELYLLAGGNDTFTVAKDNGAFKQDVDIGPGGVDTLVFGDGTFSGEVIGCDPVDAAAFVGNADISGMNSGGPLGVGTASFSDLDLTVAMTAAQHNDFGTPFLSTGGTQTILLITAGNLTGDIGIENYVTLGDNDYVFTFAPDNAGLVGGSQNLDLVDPGFANDTAVFGPGTFSGRLDNAGKGDTVQFSGGSADISGLNAGAATGAEFVSFSDSAVSATMTLAQHNAFSTAFLNAAGTQTVALSTNGTAVGAFGIEQYFLGQDGKAPNFFTVGAIDQSVTGGNDDDTVIYNYGGVSGVLRGGANTANGDTLILGASNSVLAAGSGEFENLTFAAAGSSKLTMTAQAHSGLTGVINAPGTDDTITLTTAINGSGLQGIENYQLISSTGTNFFFFTDSQTGTVSGADNRADNFSATALQIAHVTLLYGGAGTNTGNLLITTDAAGLDLATRTKNINQIQLLAGSSANVIGANNFGGNQVSVSASADTIYTMGTGGFQSYQGFGGRDDVTFSTPTGAYQLGPSDDILRSKVGGAITVFVLDGGAGTDILSLSNGDDTSGVFQFNNFEVLDLANNASVTMKGSQYSQFTALLAAPGVNTINIVTDTLTGTTVNGVENYVLADGTASNAAYKINGDNQTITDNNTAGFSSATIVGFHSNVTLSATAGTRYLVIDNDGGANHTIILSGDVGLDQVSVGGGHTALSVDLGDGPNELIVSGVVSGVLRGGADSDQLTLLNTADISDATVSNFDTLVFDLDASVTMSAATWDQFVANDGSGYAYAHNSEQVTLTTTTVNTAAFTSKLFGVVESYVLSNAGNDFFTVNQFVNGKTYNTNVALVAGGNDFLTFNDLTAAPNGNDVSTTVIGFQSGGAVGFDTVAVKLNGTAVSNAGFYNIAAANTDVDTKAAHTAFTVATSVATIVGTWTETAALSALDTAIGMINTGDYTMTVYNGASADVMAVQIVDADNLATAKIDLIGVLTNVGVNTLVAQNFS
ncbi:MAG: DUF4214 domain-containing protein [Reyranellaceae bacterium]